jgi:glycogen synthase
VIEEKRNGFTFEYPDEGGVDWVVNRAYKLYQQEPHSFFLLALKNMHEDHSWTQAAQGYLELYTILGLNFKA